VKRATKGDRLTAYKPVAAVLKTAAFTTNSVAVCRFVSSLLIHTSQKGIFLDGMAVAHTGTPRSASVSGAVDDQLDTSVC